MQKTQFIAELKNGQEVSSLFALASARQGQAKNGPFWKLELKDAGGSLEAKIWSPQSQAYPELQAGSVVFVQGRVGMYREKMEIAVERLEQLAPEEEARLNWADFMPASAVPAAEMLEDLRALCRENISHGPWKKFMKLLLRHEEVLARLPLAPAAKGMHHVYAGGLLEHTLGVARNCLALADLYPQLDRQILLAGAICHDLGKLWELSQGLQIDYTTEGRLFGHIQIALDFLEPLLKKSGLEAELILHFKHLILSHHGSFEFGSPRLPSTAEALILHYADNIDAKLNQVRNALSSLEEGESGWSAYAQGLDRFLYQSAQSPEKRPKARSAATEEDAPKPGQLSLLPD